MIYKIFFFVLLSVVICTLSAGEDKYRIKVSRDEVIKAAKILASKGGFTAIVTPNVSFKIKPNEDEGRLTIGRKLTGTLTRNQFFSILKKNPQGLYELNLEQTISSNPVSALYEMAGIDDTDIGKLTDKKGVPLSSRGEEYKAFGLVQFQDTSVSCKQKKGTSLKAKLACARKAKKDNRTVAKNYEGVQNLTLAMQLDEQIHQLQEEIRANQEETRANQEETRANQEETRANQEETRANQEETRANQEETRANQEKTRANQEEAAAAQRAIDFHQQAIDEAKELMKQ